MIIEEIFNNNHIRRYSDKEVKIKNQKTGFIYEVAEDWTNEWFLEHGMDELIYVETDIQIEKKEK